MAKYTFEQLNAMDIFDSADIIAAMTDNERQEILTSISQSTLVQIENNREKVSENFRKASARINALI